MAESSGVGALVGGDPGKGDSGESGYDARVDVDPIGDSPLEFEGVACVSFPLDRDRFNRSRSVRGGVGGTASTLCVLTVEPLRLWPLPRRSNLDLIAATTAKSPPDDDDRRCIQTGNPSFGLTPPLPVPLVSLSLLPSPSPSSSLSFTPLLSLPLARVGTDASCGFSGNVSPSGEPSDASRLSGVRRRRAACAVTNLLRFPNDERRRCVD